mgnify:CR=1 FL=1
MILVNGQETSSIHVTDRGFQYGDGCFSTLEVRSGAPLFWSRHRSRLERDCSRLHIPFECADALDAEVIAVAASGGDGVLKVILTRGVGGRGYRWPDVLQPSRVISFHLRPDYPASWASSGVVLRLCQTRLGINPSLAGIKHMNRLEQVLARNEWPDAEVQEGLLLDTLGWVVEGTMSNLFLVRSGRLETPRLDRCGVAGVMRELIMELATSLGMAVREVRCRLPHVSQSDEIFLTNSLIGVWPVRRLENQQWQPGPITLGLANAVEQAKNQESLQSSLSRGTLGSNEGNPCIA